jgi:WD40 repeat protein
MADVFISYSRRDAPYAEGLATALQQRGRSVWLDTHGIEDGEVFPAALRRAIEESDGFVFVISPASAASPYCRQEVDHAVELGKRIVPIVHRETPADDLPPGIRERQWIIADGAAAVDRIAHALAADPEHTREHTRLSLRARDWDERGRRRTDLPRGADLAEAESWLVGAQGRDPAPAPLQAAWVAAGRGASARRLRTLTGAAIGVAVLSAALLIFALVSRDQVAKQRSAAGSRALAGASRGELGRSPQRALLLAREALRKSATPEAELAATQALDADTLRGVSSAAGGGQCDYSHRMVRLPGPPSRVAISTCAGDVLVRAVAGGRVLRRIDLGSEVRDLALSPAGTTLAAATAQGVALIDPRTGVRTRTLLRGDSVYVLAWDPDGRRLAVGSSDDVSLVDPETGRVRVVLPVSADRTDVEGLTWVDDRRLLLSGQRYAGKSPLAGAAAVLDVDTGDVRPIALGTPREVPYAETAVVSADGRTWWFAGSRFDGEDDTADEHGRVWAVDARTRRVVEEHVSSSAAQAGSMAVSADGTSLAVGYAGGFAEVLDARTLRQTVAHAGALRAARGILFLGGDSVLPSGQDGVLRTWAPRAGERLVRPVVRHAALAFSRDGREIVASGPRSVVYDARTGRRLRGARGWRASGGLSSSVASGDGRLFGWTGIDETPPRWHVIETITGRPLGAVAYDSPSTPPGITRDGRAITVRATDEGIVPSLTPLSGARPRRLRGARIGRCGAGSPRTSAGDRRLMIVGECTSFAVWDVRSGRVVRTVRLNDRLLLQEGGISPDGNTAVVATASGGLARTDLRTGRTLQRPALRPDVATLRVSPDGRWAVTVTASGVIDVYETRALRLVRSHALTAGGWSAIAFSPDSRRLAVSDRDPRRLAAPVLHVWDVCDSCRDPDALRRRLDRRALRPLTVDERRLFAVDD